LLANMSTMHYLAGDPLRGIELLEEAKRLIGDAATPNAARVHFAVTRMAVSDATLAPALEAAERTIAIATDVGPESVLIDALLMKGLALGVMHSVERGVDVVLEARRRAETAQLMNQVVVSYRVENQIRSIQQSPLRAIPVVEEGLAIAEEHCGTQLQLTLRLDLAVCLLDAGRFAEARPIIGPLLDTVIVNVRQVAVHLTAAMLALTDDDFDEVKKHLALGDAIAERFQSAQETGVQKRALAEFARHEGRLDDALSLIKEAVKLQDGNDHRAFTRETMLEKARIVHAIAGADGDWSEERERTRNSIGTLDPFEDLPTRTVCELARFELDRIDEPFDLPRARQLTEDLIECGLAYEVARHRLVIAEHLVASRAPVDETEAELRALIELASTNGMHWIETQARELARQKRLTIEMPADEDDVGHAAPSRAPDAVARELPNGLTAREVEVLALVAEGLTNKAIGERLFVSHRTVGTHVSNLLAKLHLSSRGEAIAKYHQLRLDRLDLRDPLEVD
jgi:ATP/maltotriose-dependent transcriptional regulator MalT